MTVIRPKIIESIDSLSRKNYTGIKKEISKMTDKQRDEYLDHCIYTMADLQRKGEVVDQMYRKAILEQDVEQALAIGTSAQFDVPMGNPKIFDWLRQKTDELTQQIIARVAILKGLEDYIKGYPLKSIQLDLSITPKISLLFQKRDERSNT